MAEAVAKQPILSGSLGFSLNTFQNCVAELYISVSALQDFQVFLHLRECHQFSTFLNDFQFDLNGMDFINPMV